MSQKLCLKWWKMGKYWKIPANPEKLTLMCHRNDDVKTRACVPCDYILDVHWTMKIEKKMCLKQHNLVDVSLQHNCWRFRYPSPFPDMVAMAT